MSRVLVIGGGAWGTALAVSACRAGHDTTVWMRDGAAADAIERRRENVRYLPGVRLPDRLRATADRNAATDAEIALSVLPAQAMRAGLQPFAALLPAACPLVVCAKGVERGTGAFVTEVAAATRPGGARAVLSGPSFAVDVARGLPTAVTLAAADRRVAAALAASLSGPSLRVYWTTDVRGVEIGGAAKNVLAIGAGMVEGRGLGESAKAALLARGFAELLRFAAAHGAQSETLMGLSGLGDVSLTCASSQSRNHALGVGIGRGERPDAAAGGKLAEGALTADALLARADRAGIEMPVARAVADVLAGRVALDDAVATLLARPLRAEADGPAR